MRCTFEGEKGGHIYQAGLGKEGEAEESIRKVLQRGEKIEKRGKGVRLPGEAGIGK